MFKNLLYSALTIAVIAVAISIVYYFFFFLPQTKETEEARLVRENCIKQVDKQAEEIRSLTTYDPRVEDRGCYLEAGCMQGVEDPNYQAKFDSCNQAYYQECLSDLKEEEAQKFEVEKQSRIDTCINADTGR